MRDASRIISAIFSFIDSSLTKGEEMLVKSDKVVYKLDASEVPAVVVESGAELEIETLDCFDNQLLAKGATFESLAWDHTNPATGPVYVNGAEPGDTLKVTIKKIDLHEYGTVACLENEGTLGHRIKGSHFKNVPVKDGVAYFSDELQIPVKPMIGVIGVAPEGKGVGCGTPGPHGGNMDNTMIGAGCTMYFPVFAKGALFALGDMHAVMGDGEIGVTGLEIPGKITLTLEVIKGKSFANPMLETEDVIAAIVSDENLEAAASKATEMMLDFITSNTEMSVPDAVMLMSLTGNAEICQMVDPLRTARFVMPKKYIGVKSVF
jgi:Predicted acetamidase/formamidase